MSLYALHLANGRTSNTGVLRLMGRLLSGSGVIESTAFTVAAQSTPDMTIKVSGSATADNLVIITSTGDTYYGWNTANANVTITSNATGVTKKDHIVAYVDTALTTVTPDNPTGLVLIAVRGSSTLAPTDGEINTATSSKPWLRLAEVSVANGASSINSGNITDLRVFAKVPAHSIGAVATTATYNLALNHASITSLVTIIISGSSTSNPSIARCEGILDISGLGISSDTLIVETHFWANAAGNLVATGYYPLEVLSVSNTTVAFRGVIIGDGQAGNNFPNTTNSKLQGYIRYIA